jgi:hypothetical protein
MDGRVLDRESLQGLKKIYPTPEELALLRLEGGSSVGWQSAERYMLRLASIPNFMAKLECWCLKEDYLEMENSILEPLMTIKLAMEDILKSRLLKLVLSVILDIGNYLNGGRYLSLTDLRCSHLQVSRDKSRTS